MRAAEAELLALQALGWLAGDPERAGAFLAAAGAVPEAMAEGARDPVFLGFVLDHLLAEDARVLDFAAEHDVVPETLARARAALPGGDVPDWT